MRFHLLRSWCHRLRQWCHSLRPWLETGCAGARVPGARVLGARVLGGSVLGFMVLGSGCGGNPNTPEPPPPVGEPAITCPASFSVNTSTPTTVVTYAAPVASGGTPPTTVSCTVESGGTVPVGTTAVTCTNTDNIGRRATCGFNITVVLRVFVKYTNFWAFGDSITAGEVSTSSLFSIKAVDPINNYPVVLRGLLNERYAQQTVSVGNHGSPAEPADAGADRLRAELIAGPVPQVLLLLEGTNEMLTRNDELVATIAQTLSVDIDEARVRGVKEVMLATFPPVRSGIRGDMARPYIEPVNNQVRALAAQKGVILVDLHAAMVGQESTLIGDDGLHPTVAGYRRIAETFATAIKNAFELTSAPTTQRR